MWLSVVVMALNHAWFATQIKQAAESLASQLPKPGKAKVSPQPFAACNALELTRSARRHGGVLSLRRLTVQGFKAATAKRLSIEIPVADESPAAVRAIFRSTASLTDEAAPWSPSAQSLHQCLSSSRLDAVRTAHWLASAPPQHAH